jgi:muramidase (phage lysozyme)
VNEFEMFLRQNLCKSDAVGEVMPVVLRVLILFLFVQTAHAEAVGGSLFITTPTDARAPSAGLFIGRDARGLFADRPAHDPAFADKLDKRLRGSDVQVIRALIQEAESRRDGYDAVQHGARIKPNKRPTDMTLAEVFQWIDDTPGQPHAIGRYQFIPQTLRRVVAKVGVKPSDKFSPKIQDKLADVLLVEAGLKRFRTGVLERQAFMNNLAKIWAGLPNSTGKSHYDGYAGNKASVSWARFDAVMQRISPG